MKGSGGAAPPSCWLARSRMGYCVLSYSNSSAYSVNKTKQTNESWEWLEIHEVLLIRLTGNGTEGLQRMREDFKAENKGIVNPTQLRWLANPVPSGREGRTEKLPCHRKFSL